MGGHSGFPVTYLRIHSLFHWTGMKAFIKDQVQSCVVCQQAKPERVPYPGLLSPLPVPQQAWEMIFMDFINGLPTSGSSNCIFVVIDKFTKYGHFIPLHHPFNAQKVVEAFVDHVYKLHGMPKYIVSDRDSVFTRQFWQALAKLTGSELKMSLAYHPETDGQTERVNQQIEYYLRCFISTNPNRWARWLPLCEFWYNTNWHSVLNKSPFEVLYGHSPRYFVISASDTILPADLQTWLDQRQVVTASVRQHLLRAQQRMKIQADKHRTERSFIVGDLVFLKLQPYVQSSVVHSAHHKLAFRFYGPYKVVQKIGKHRVRQQGHRTIAQVLIQWSDADLIEATWENLESLKQQFPRALAWGQANSQERGGVSDLEELAPEQLDQATTGPRPTQPMKQRQLPAWLASPELVR